MTGRGSEFTVLIIFLISRNNYDSSHATQFQGFWQTDYMDRSSGDYAIDFTPRQLLRTLLQAALKSII